MNESLTEPAVEGPTAASAPERAPLRPRTSTTPTALSDATPDRMTLHTTEALLLFSGRSGEDSAAKEGIPGGRRFAAILKTVWHLSGRDHPYADWLLIRMGQGLDAVRAYVAVATREHEARLDDLRHKGMSLTVMSARHPHIVHLGFSSPYGYAMAEAVLEFDRFVRVVKTLIHKDRLGDLEGRAAIRSASRRFRALFQEPIRWERALLDSELRFLCRGDFLPEADAAARQRVALAERRLGPISPAVLACDERPRHTQQRSRLTEAQRQTLRERRVDDGDIATPESEPG